jgi:hypothetical protein
MALASQKADSLLIAIFGQPHLTCGHEQEFFVSYLVAREGNELRHGLLSVAYDDFLSTFRKSQIFAESVFAFRDVHSSHGNVLYGCYSDNYL